jgi:hypothetical protein
MINKVKFGYGSSLGNDSVYGAPSEWVWVRNGAGVSAAYDEKGYAKQRDFFSVLWQVKIAKGHPIDEDSETSG